MINVFAYSVTLLLLVMGEVQIRQNDLIFEYYGVPTYDTLCDNPDIVGAGETLLLSPPEDVPRLLLQTMTNQQQPSRSLTNQQQPSHSLTNQQPQFEQFSRSAASISFSS